MTAAGRDVSAGEAFVEYAAWYDAFNVGKDYAAEVDSLLSRIERWTGLLPRRWLDVGCGTGQHLAHLRARGLSVEGVDRSTRMIARAREAHPGITFHVGTAQDYRLEPARDVISLLFHVMSYQVEDDHAQRAITNAAAHLAPGGVLVFDFWHSEALRRDPPRRRVRDGRISGRPLFRISTPRLGLENRVAVEFEFRWDAVDGALAHRETHVLRARTQADWEALVRTAGLSVVACEGFSTGAPLCPDDWYGLLCARREEPQ
jgi:SAM-dependent methyltransferase